MSLPEIALSVRQPWAWAIVAGHKDIENRGRFAITKGEIKPREICIHAAKGMTRSEYEKTRVFIEEMGIEVPMPNELIRGAIIGTCTVERVVRKHHSPWFFGDSGLVLRDAKAIEPIPCHGALGYFKWTEYGKAEASKPWMEHWAHMFKTRGEEFSW